MSASKPTLPHGPWRTVARLGTIEVVDARGRTIAYLPPRPGASAVAEALRALGGGP